MSLNIGMSDDGATTTITLPEKFDFSIHSDFRQMYQNSHTKKFVLDMRKTEYMDSAALGMLLQLREHIGNERSAIKVTNTKENVREILEIANFDKLLELS